MDHHGPSLHCSWTVHGPSMDPMYRHYGPPWTHQGTPWVVYGLFMDCSWTVHELPWTVHGPTVGCLWTTMDPSRNHHGPTTDHIDRPWWSMVGPWTVHGQCMVPPCRVYGRSVVVHSASMVGLRCRPVAMAVHGGSMDSP